jgi:hypothetical protein
VLNGACEESCAKLENELPGALAAVEAGWPLSLDGRGVIAQFLALHVLRTRAFPDWFEPVRNSSLAQYHDRFPSRKKYEKWKREMQSDRERSKKLLSLINKLSTVFGSMHWSLLRFDEPLLITGDQPVCPVPLLGPGAIQPVAAIPRDGWLDTCEIRCPLTPRLALIATWYMGPETAPVDGTWAQAVNLNAGTRAQAVEQYFQTPEREPALPAAIFAQPQPPLLAPISIDVLPGYSMAVAAESARRDQTTKRIEELIEKQDHETITVITSEVGAPA